jgi:hypothetical protein
MAELADSHAVEHELLERYRAKRESALRDLADAQARADKYRLAVQGLEAVLGIEDGDNDAPAAPKRMTRDTEFIDGPRGETAVGQFLLDQPGRGFTAQELTEGLRERRWINPDVKDPVATTRAAANRLRRKYDDYTFTGGRYAYAPSSREEPAPNPFVAQPEGV